MILATLLRPEMICNLYCSLAWKLCCLENYETTWETEATVFYECWH